MITQFLILLVVSLLACSCGFIKYVWFISLGYGAAISALGVTMLIMFNAGLDVGTIIMASLFIVYGFRLGGYLAVREIKSASYNRKISKEIKANSVVPFAEKIAIWFFAALLYVCQVSPLWLRLSNGFGTDTFLIVGAIIMALGITVTSIADFQKSRAKKENPNRFVDTGLYRLVRCPNYLGEVIAWTGVFITGINVCQDALQWVIILCGYLGIVYVMFSGARRLELRQVRTYGKDPVFQEYVRHVPILLPFIPLYSVAKYKWLVG